MSEPAAVKHVFVTGEPGAGKTTLIQHVVRELEGVPVAGFVTAEVRGPDGQREGFDVITLQGQRVPLARTAAALQRDCTATMCRDGPSVGRYCVLPEFEACVMPELQQWLLSQSTPHSRRVLLVLDEVRERSAAVVPLMCRGANKQVGKMELTSHAFVQAVRQCLDADGIILGTIPTAAGLPLVECIRARGDTEVHEVSHASRDAQFSHVLARVRCLLSERNNSRSGSACSASSAHACV